MTRAVRAERWLVDALEEGIARIVIGDGEPRTIAIPAVLLPSGVREGDLLLVHRDEESERSVRFTLSIDAAATRRARARVAAKSARTLSASRKRDPGGDVAL